MTDRVAHSTLTPLAVGDRVKEAKGTKLGTVSKIKYHEETGKLVLVIWDGEAEKQRNRFKSADNVVKIDPETNKPVRARENPGAYPGFPAWANPLNFTLDQQKRFVDSNARVHHSFLGPCEEANELERQLGLTAEQRNGDEGKVTIAQSRATPAGVKSLAYRRILYQCKCGRNAESRADDQPHWPDEERKRGPGLLWPKLGCPFALKAKYMLIAPAGDGAIPGLETSENRAQYYLRDVEGCVEHSQECGAARPLRLRRRPDEVRRGASKKHRVEELTEEAFSPYGLIMGGARPTPRAMAAGVACIRPGSEFWNAHYFNPGHGGQTEVLWANYRNASLLIETLEVNLMAEQAIVPILGGGIIVAVCPSMQGVGGVLYPDVKKLQAFQVDAGVGVCLKPGVWHTVFVGAGEVRCMVLSRGSSTRDMVRHLNGLAPATETRVVALGSLQGERSSGPIRLKPI